MTRGEARRARCATAAWIAALIPFAPVAAQDDAIEEVVVTGSRIARADFESASPIVTLPASAFEQTSAISVERTLNTLPQFAASATGTSNDPANDGQANVSLRGIGVGPDPGADRRPAPDAGRRQGLSGPERDSAGADRERRGRDRRRLRSLRLGRNRRGRQFQADRPLRRHRTRRPVVADRPGRRRRLHDWLDCRDLVRGRSRLRDGLRRIFGARAGQPVGSLVFAGSTEILPGRNRRSRTGRRISRNG